MSFLAREHSKKNRPYDSVGVPAHPGQESEAETARLAVHAVTRPSPQSHVRANSAEEVVAQAILPGERVLAFAPCLRRVALQLFEKASVVVTDQRVLVVAPGFPWGYELKEIHSRAACAILTGRERKDGSRLLIVRVGKDKLCLFFARSHQQEADDVLNAIRMEPIVSSREIDKGSLEHEFSALSELPDQDED